MKTKILFSIILLISSSLIMSGCKKKETTGTLYFKNTQVDPYTIYLDGTNEGILASGNTSSAYTVTEGVSHTVKAVQYSGYILIATSIPGTVTIDAGGSATWSF